MCFHTATLSVVTGLTNWFSDHLGACVWSVMVYPAQKNQNQIRIAEFLWDILPICSKASTPDLGVAPCDKDYLTNTRGGKITDNCFGGKWLFFSLSLLARQISADVTFQSWPMVSTSRAKTNKQPDMLITEIQCNYWVILQHLCHQTSIVWPCCGLAKCNISFFNIHFLNNIKHNIKMRHDNQLH